MLRAILTLLPFHALFSLLIERHMHAMRRDAYAMLIIRCRFVFFSAGATRVYFDADASAAIADADDAQSRLRFQLILFKDIIAYDILFRCRHAASIFIIRLFLLMSMPSMPRPRATRYLFLRHYFISPAALYAAR